MIHEILRRFDRVDSALKRLEKRAKSDNALILNVWGCRQCPMKSQLDQPICLHPSERIGRVYDGKPPANCPMRKTPICYEIGATAGKLSIERNDDRIASSEMMAKQTLKQALYLIRLEKSPALARAAAYLRNCPVGGWAETAQAKRRILDELPLREARSYSLGEFIETVYKIDHRDYYVSALD